MKIWYMVVSHQHGANTYLGTSLEEVQADLFEDFVAEQWAELMPDTAMPDNAGLAIEQYFHGVSDIGGDEWFRP